MRPYPGIGQASLGLQASADVNNGFQTSADVILANARAGQGVPPPPPRAPDPPAVVMAILQAKLEALGYGKVPETEKGFIIGTRDGANVGGPVTQAMVERFQRNANLPPTAIFDAATVAEINRALPGPPPAPSATPPLASSASPLTRGVFAALSEALANVNRYAPRSAPLVQQQVDNLGRGMALDPNALLPAIAELRAFPATAGNAGAQQALTTLLTIVQMATPTTNGGGGGIRTTSTNQGQPDTAATGAPSRSLLQKVGIGLLLTSPVWGMALWQHRQHP